MNVFFFLGRDRPGRYFAGEDRVMCVRYRYDDKRQKRLKTVGLIVEEEEWIAPKPSPRMRTSSLLP
jgi:hypothetical protein